MTIEPTHHALSVGRDIEMFVRDARGVHQVANALATTSFVPAAFRGKPDEITAAILFGQEINLDPMVALQSIHVIEGRPSLSALAMRGKAQAAGVKFKLIESTETRCRMAAKAPGDEQWTEILWSIDRAKKLGLTGKSNWTKQPQAMLIARATSELCRLVAANTFLGFGYSSEELQDGTGDDAAGGTYNDPTPKPSKRTVRRQPVQATVDFPQPEPEPAAAIEGGAAQIESAPPRESNIEPIDINVRKALMAKFNEAGISARTDRLAFVTEVVGREVSSVNDINTDEGKAVLRALDELPAVEDGDWPPTPEVPA